MKRVNQIFIINYMENVTLFPRKSGNRQRLENQLVEGKKLRNNNVVSDI